MPFNPILFFVLALQASQALGHGYVKNFIVEGGKSYRGNAPAEGARRDPSVVRQIANTNPVQGSYNPNLVCGQSATSASLVADVNPGDNVLFDWTGAGNTAWPHQIGPILTYMASCGSVSCDKFDPAGAKWFKISNLVKKSNGEWFQADVRRRIPMKVQIPSNLAPGNYMIRQEIIALHLATGKGGVEFYPSCTQLRVGGSQTGRPAESDLHSIPGIYYDEHPGLWTKNLYQPNFKYEVPGPAVAKIGGSGGAPPPEPTKEPAPTTSSSSTTTKTRTSSSSSVRPTPEPETSTTPKPTSTPPSSTPTATKTPENNELPPPVANAAKPPSATSAAPVTTPSPEVIKLCRHRKRSSLKYMQKRAAAAEPSPIAAPLRSRHSRRAMFRHGSH